ncbi:hypothetical protein [Actinomadura rugatobispora]|uniref:RidA family protein n=1 Tax=Actinomadura rugatobispora TaxID=1994 RepID=A0ABW0ZYB1_9ACTN|nr:hypothetical protein GCM10010200_091470 [Actinomadura rugatobispora]
MTARTENPAGGYAYVPGLSFASQGVAALPGFTIVRAVLPRPLPLAAGFAAVERRLADEGRPPAALCGLELRMPGALTRQGFVDFNAAYVGRLDAWGLLRDGVPPLARTNVIPVGDPPPEPAVHAFSYTVPGGGPGGTYVVSGVAEVPLGSDFPTGIVRPGERDADALGEKATVIIGEIRRCLDALGVRWEPSDPVTLYSPHAVAAEVAHERLAAVAGVRPRSGVAWQRTWPPVTGLELELDVRRVGADLYLP